VAARLTRLVLLFLGAGAVGVGAQTPQLGSPVDGFTARFGKPVRNAAGAIYDFEKCPGRTALARWGITVENGRVVAINRNACPGEKLDPADSRREAAQFEPADAKRVRPFQTQDGWSAEERRSASLAKQLPASAFKTCKGAAPPGTFSYMLSPERRSWLLALGTCL
jgi:hypothetical protein